MLQKDTPYCNRWCQLTIIQMRARWSKSELNKWCCSMLSFVFIYPVRMHTVYTQFWKIVSVHRDPSQCQQTIGEFISITRMSKQHPPIAIVHQSPVNVLEDRDNTITSYSTILHSQQALLASCACDGITFRMVYSAICLAPKNFER